MALWVFATPEGVGIRRRIEVTRLGSEPEYLYYYVRDGPVKGLDPVAVCRLRERRGASWWRRVQAVAAVGRAVMR